jgi:sugar fermentation stimulation protein A
LRKELLTVEMLPVKGVYTLILFLSKEIRLKVGKLGTQRFPRGYYTYTGSALGIGSSSLKYRVLRHLKKKKRKFWHIDFLLGHKNVYLTGLIAANIDKRVECKINRYIKTKERAKIPVPHFGASDCKKNCGSHLLYFGEENIKQRITWLYNEILGMEPITVDFAEMT